MRRTEPKGEGSSYGVFLSDGTINMAVLHFGWDQGHGLDYRGIHHLGVLVDDVDAYTEKLEKLGADCFAKRPPGQQGFYETKFHGPDNIIFDITDHPWAGSAPLDADTPRRRRRRWRRRRRRLTPEKEGRSVGAFFLLDQRLRAAARLPERSLALAPCAAVAIGPRHPGLQWTCCLQSQTRRACAPLRTASMPP